jgi:hypothetical protein
MAEAFEVDLAGGEHARGTLVSTEDALDEALGALDIPPGPVILLYGGAARLEDRHRARIERFLAAAFMPAVAGLGAIVIDGGTDAGVMRMVGEARERAGARIRIVGVAPFGKVRVPGSQGSTELAPGHTDFVLVPGEAWGAESGWFHPIASRLSSGPVVTVLVNGGPIALQEVERSIQQGGRVLVVDGTGRAADDVAAAIRRPAGRDPALSAIADSASITIVDVTIGPADLATKLFTSGEGEHEG